MNTVHAGLPLPTWSRLLAWLLFAAFLIALWAGAGDAVADADWSARDAFTVAAGAWLGLLAAYVAWTGREPSELATNPLMLLSWLRGTHPGRASAAEIERLRQLGASPGLFTSAGEARRTIALLEGRLPPTLEQQAELARYRPGHAVMTRASAQRFLAEEHARDAWVHAECWREEWAEAGVEIEHAQALSPREREAFGQAYLAIISSGIPYPLQSVLSAFELPGETARMQLAPEILEYVDQAQRELAREGVLRRELRPEELRGLFSGVIEMWRREPEFDHGQVLLYLIARQAPALLTNPWALQDFVRETDECLADRGE